MRALARWSGTLVLLIVLLSSVIPVAAQQNPEGSKSSCVAADEPIYGVGGDVKPPEPHPDKNARNPPDIRGSMSLELLVNSEGRVCEARVLNATDRLSATKTANFILEHWRFRPAMRQGKAVAVRFTMNFNNPR
jgi:TonB family protein